MLDIQATLEAHYPDFFERHSRSATILSRFLRFLCYETRFQQFSSLYPHLEGFEFVEQVLRHFEFDVRLTESERARIPSTGRVVIAANHPIGSLDGLALLNLVRGVRPDVKVVANDLLTAISPLHLIITAAYKEKRMDVFKSPMVSHSRLNSPSALSVKSSGLPLPTILSVCLPSIKNNTGVGHA